MACLPLSFALVIESEMKTGGVFPGNKWGGLKLPCFPCQSFVLLRVVINLLKNRLALTLASQIHDRYCWPCLSDGAGGELWKHTFCLFIIMNASVTCCSAEAAACCCEIVNYSTVLPF